MAIYAGQHRNGSHYVDKPLAKLRTPDGRIGLGRRPSAVSKRFPRGRWRDDSFQISKKNVALYFTRGQFGDGNMGITSIVLQR